MFRPEYRWNHIRTDILDAYARQHFTLDLLIWDIPDIKIESFVYPEEQKRVIKMAEPQHCYFCQAAFTPEYPDEPDSGLYKEEVGEFWSNELDESVLAHADCVPEGTFEGTNEEWSMA
jgi:hypothetical protein